MKTTAVPISWVIEEGHRFDCGPFTRGGLEAKKILESSSHTKHRLVELTNGGIAGMYHVGMDKLRWVEEAQHGVALLRSSDILRSDLTNQPLIARSQVRANRLFTCPAGSTLITRSGTVGRMAYCRSEMAQMAISQDVLKVVPDSDKIKSGYLFAFLSSKFGVPLVVSGTFGSIIVHIEAENIAELPVPRLGPKIEGDIHTLIETAASNRSRSEQLRQEAQSVFSKQFALSDLTRADTAVHRAIFSVKVSTLQRLDAAHYSPACRAAADELASCGETKQLNQVARVFTPGIFKRVHVEDPKYGYPYFSGTELFRYDPKPRGHLSRRAPNIEDYIVGENWLLIQDAGQLEGLIGRVVRVTPFVAHSVVSNHLMRVATDDVEDMAYLSVVLSSPHGYRAITRNAFGSSIPQLDPAHIGSLRVPWPSSAIRKRIAKPVLAAWALEDEASSSVHQAVQKVEHAIEKGAR